jgi:hypothetical protein
MSVMNGVQSKAKRKESKMIYVINTEEELSKLNHQYFQQYPEVKDVKWWARCNYYKNKGNNEGEPIGTALSMHECGDCVDIKECLVKYPTPYWWLNDGVEEEIDMLWSKMMDI